MENSNRPSRIVVAGGGFAGAYCARQLEKRLSPAEARITVVNPNNCFLFTPLLIEAGTGALEPRHTVVPHRRFLRRADFYAARISRIDLDQSRVFCQQYDGGRTSLEYDHLILAMGSMTLKPNVPGLDEHGFTIKSLGDAVALRDRAVSLLELAAQTDDPEKRKEILTFVVVGGSYTGVEVAGEFNQYLTQATELYSRIEPEDIRVVLANRGDRILKTLDKGLSEYASECLRKQGVELRLNQAVTEIGPRTATLESGETVPGRTVIWAAGVAPHPLLTQVDAPRDSKGYLQCEADLRLTGSPNVWAIGDCAANPDPKGNPYPATAQHAIREGGHAAKNITRVLHERSTKPFVYNTRGMMAPLGYHRGVARLGPFKIRGFPAWLLWRTFYLLKMPLPSRTLRIMMDWSLDLFFRREFFQMGLHGSRQPGDRGK